MSDDNEKRPRTKFEPVPPRRTQPERPPPEAAATPAPPQQQAPPSQRPPAPEPAPAPGALPALRALEPEELPRYPGLRHDPRGAVVGSQGLVVIRHARRLSAFLAALSHVADLSRGVQVEPQEDGLPALVTLTPDEDEPLAFDTILGALAAARLSRLRARLYVGDGRVFVPYIHPAAPDGFDADGPPPAEGRALLDPEGATLLPPPRPADLLATLTAAPLLPAPPAEPATLAVLTDRRLAPLVAGYAQRHGLAYAARFLTWQRGEWTAPAVLFDIVVAGEVRPIPRFVGDFLRRLPHTELLADALEPADLESEPPRRVLIAQGWRAPLYWPNIQELLPEGSLLVLAGAPWGSSLISPTPPRQPIQQLTEITVAAPGRATLSDRAPGRLRLPLALAPGASTRGPVHGLLLDDAALTRLRRIVRRLPGPLFARLRIAVGDGVALLVAAEPTGAVDGLPLGEPLSHAEPPELLLPRGMRLLPALPQDLVVQALGLAPDTLTVLTATHRYDVPQDALQPLGALLMLDGMRQVARIEVRPTPLPPLDLSDLEEPVPAPVVAPTPAPADSPPPAQRREDRSSLNVLRNMLGIESGEKRRPFEEELRERADELARKGELETAAAFYTHLGDHERAADCYKRLVGKQPS